MTQLRPLPRQVRETRIYYERFGGSTSLAEVLRRAELLPREDREIFRLVMERGASLRELALARGKNAGSISRWVRTVERRLMGSVARALAHRGSELTGDFRQIAVEHFLLGKSQKALIREYGLPRKHLLAIISFVQGWANR